MSSRYRVCKRYGEDIWGDFFGIKRNVRVIYRIGRKMWKEVSRELGGDLDWLWGRMRRKYAYRRKKRKTEYGESLLNKQRIKVFYGLREKGLVKGFLKSPGLKEVLGEYERRLDVVLYRSNLVKTIGLCKQLIRNGFVCVNGNIMRKSSYRVNEGDIVNFAKEIHGLLLRLVKKDMRLMLSCKRRQYEELRRVIDAQWEKELSEYFSRNKEEKVSGILQQRVSKLKRRCKCKKGVCEVKEKKLRKLYEYIPQNLEIDYGTLNILFMKVPREGEIFYPFDLDTSRLYELYGHYNKG